VKRRSLFLLLSLLVVGSMLLTACGGATPTAEEPAAPEPAATEEPAPEEPEAPFEPTVLEAPNCDYGGFFKKIEAVDEFTVVFELCKPDPAFLSKIAFSVFSIYPWREHHFRPQRGLLG